jgi:hypothetical protein
MRKSLKRWPVLLTLLVAVGTLTVVVVCLPYRSRVTRENCERIKEGMTRAEVRAVLGRPWDDALLDPEGLSKSDESMVVDVWVSKVRGKLLTSTPVSCSLWMGSSNLGLFVVFDENDRVAFTVLCTDPDRPRSWLPARVWQRLRARYGW